MIIKAPAIVKGNLLIGEKKIILLFTEYFMMRKRQPISLQPAIPVVCVSVSATQFG